VITAGEKVTARRAELVRGLEQEGQLRDAILHSADGGQSDTVKILGNGYPPADLKVVTPADVVAAVNYLVNLPYGVGTTDDIDHLGNRRLKTVGELLQNQFRIGLSRMERVIRERMTIRTLRQ